MAVFLVAAPGPSPKLAASIASAVPTVDVYALAPNQWLVSIPNVTAQQAAAKLGIGDDPTVTAIVVSIGTYWGRHNRDVWEWIAAKMAAASG